MSMHPELTTSVYILIAVVFAAFVIGLIIYTRRMNLNKVTMELKGRAPVDKEEAILLATRQKEGRSGPPTTGRN